MMESLSHYVVPAFFFIIIIFILCSNVKENGLTCGKILSFQVPKKYYHELEGKGGKK